ncbi:MAG: hypothetical protein M1389_00020 [Chloroflexi bacterium]|nr:hypothetical protein [Chloroflexota bacterium]
MARQKTALEDALSAVGGWWYRGEAHIVEVNMGPLGTLVPPLPDEKLKVVAFDGFEQYRLTRGVRSAAHELCDLSEDGSDDRICKFARRHGPLLDIEPWARGVKANKIDPETVETLPICSDEDVAEDASDVLEFRRWCHRTGDPHPARYVVWACRRIVPSLWGVKRFAVPEPTALYRWAAIKMANLRRELQAGSLSAGTERWLSARLGETHLHYAGQEGRLHIRATTQLAYLTAQLILDGADKKPIRRLCPTCGHWFSATHANQRYCSSTCKDTLNKRKYRSRLQHRQPGEED